MSHPGTLYVVATPLGHLGDLSARVTETLRQVDTVAAEDTRRTQGLLASIDAHPRLISYHAHSTTGQAEALVAMLAAGRDVALVSDAGTPAISDPGHELVALARAAGITVVPIPGASAVATALSASGLPADRYLFLGFLPRKGADRKRLVARAAAEPWSVVCFEAANRLPELLDDLAAACGADRRAVVCRELTKLHEEFRAETLGALAEHYRATPARGEVTLVVAGRGEDGADDAPAADPAEVIAAVRAGLAAGESRKDLVSMVSTRFGLSRNAAYRLVMDES